MGNYRQFIDKKRVTLCSRCPVDVGNPSNYIEFTGPVTDHVSSMSYLKTTYDFIHRVSPSLSDHIDFIVSYSEKKKRSNMMKER